MKKLLTILFTLLLLAVKNNSYSQSQNLDDYPYLLQAQDGYIITNAGDTMAGKIYLGTLPAYITFTPAGETEKKRIYRKDCKEAGIVGHVFRVAEFKDAVNVIGGSDDFMEVLVDGPMMLFRRYLMVRDVKVGEGAVSQPNFEAKDIIIKPDGKSMATNDVRLLNFSKGMSKFISECPSLSNKILAKEKGYGRIDLISIVNEYNNWYNNK